MHLSIGPVGICRTAAMLPAHAARFASPGALMAASSWAYGRRGSRARARGRVKSSVSIYTSNNLVVPSWRTPRDRRFVQLSLSINYNTLNILDPDCSGGEPPRAS